MIQASGEEIHTVGNRYWQGLDHNRRSPPSIVIVIHIVVLENIVQSGDCAFRNLPFVMESLLALTFALALTLAIVLAHKTARGSKNALPPLSGLHGPGHEAPALSDSFDVIDNRDHGGARQDKVAMHAVNPERGVAIRCRWRWNCGLGSD